MIEIFKTKRYNFPIKYERGIVAMQGETNSTIKIENNVLIFGSTVLQLSNICNFEVKPRPKKKYPTIAIILILIGIGFFLVEETITFGIILLLIGVLIIITIAAENNSRGKYLIITMNSGNNFLFYCKEDSFL